MRCIHRDHRIQALRQRASRLAKPLSRVRPSPKPLKLIHAGIVLLQIASPAMDGQVYPPEVLRRQLAATNDLYLEFLRIDALSAGLYALPAGATDPQIPHKEDEIYYVTKGQAEIQIADDIQKIGPGTVIFVAKNIDHHFQNIQEDLELLVLFAPAETE